MRSIRSRSSSRRRWRSKPVELVAVDRRPLGGAVLGRRLGAGGEAEGAADPLHVDADHAGALALAAEGGDRQPRQVAHLVLVALDDRLADLLAQLVDVEPLAALAGARSPSSPIAALDRLGLGGAEEAAVEEQLEDAAVLLGLGDRRRQRLAEVVAARSTAPAPARRRRRGSPRSRPRPPRCAAPRRSRAASPPARGGRRRQRLGAVGGLGKLHPDPLGDQVDVGAVLDDDRHRLREGLAVDVLGAHQQQRPRPVDRLGDRGRLLQVERADHPTTSTSRRASASDSSGACRRTISISRSSSG